MYQDEAPEHQQYYDTAYHLVYRSSLLEQKVYNNWSEMIDKFYFTQEDRNSSLFEYGCGFGQAIAGRENRAGWDISLEARQIARSRGAIVYESFDSVERGVWDRVFCRHVLEHIETPLDALRSIAQLLTPRGQLILVIPKESHRKVPMVPDWSQHLYCWNFLTINNLLFRAGLKPISNEYRYPLGWSRLAHAAASIRPLAMSACVSVGRILRRHPEILVRAERIDSNVAAVEQ